MNFPCRVAALAACLVLESAVFGAEKIEFNRHIRPILSDQCFACHGPDKNARKADLRLDRRESALAPIEGRRPLVPGKAAESEVWRRLLSTDPDEQMPPPESRRHLTAEQKDLVRRWIDEGAEYQPHWSYRPLIAPPVPPMPATGGKNGIDAFVARDLAVGKPGWTTSPPADAVTLARRISFDIGGLPPTPEIVRAFEVDASDTAYERLVDSLLASPHFGERLALGWLDVVRYADTAGYHGDQDISVSPYRDYVIKAFNDDMPFDRFTEENLAGDLLPQATLQQRVASGYNRLNMTTEEGGSQAKEYLVKYFCDRVRTTATAWLGATMGCAQCHDHKFDPYTMKDFYAFGAFFADLDEVGVYSNRGRPPEIEVPTDAQLRTLEALEKKLAAAREAVSRKLDPRLANDEAMDVALVEDDTPGSATVSGAWNWLTKEKDKAPVHSGARSRRQESAGMIQHYFNNRNPATPLADGDRFYCWVWLDPARPPQTLMLQVHSAPAGQWEHRAWWGEDAIGYGAGAGNAVPQHFRVGDLPPAGQWVRLEVDPATVGLKSGQTFDGFSFDQAGGVVFWDEAGLFTRNREVKKRIGSDPAVMALERERDAVKAAFARTLVSASVKPRTTRVLPRGNWMDESGPEVQPAWPEFLGGKASADGRLTRLDLAHWLCSKDNPLTARVFVNRLWRQLFGTGLSKQLDELGSQGDWPTHPELLDWLAADFRDNGWKIKRLVKTIVMSAAYRQSSTLSPAQMAAGQTLEADPDNLWLGRQSRVRLDAELIRDNVLAVSGLLVDRPGGASAHPYQPAGYYAQLNFPAREYQPDGDENQWRRGVYTHWQRTFLHPMLMAFDAPSRDECTAARMSSNTPVQALVLLNDPSFVEAARMLAAMTLAEGGADFRSRLDWMFRRALQRPPTTAEHDVLKQLLEAESIRYAADPVAADALLKTGLKPVPTGLVRPELAAWTAVSRALLNLHASVTRY